MNYLIKNALIVNEGKTFAGDVLVKNGIIEKIGSNISTAENVEEINAEGKVLLPGVIDDQVHFREPGLTQKATIYTEAKAAVAGGVTSFMEMPNTKPAALTLELLADKYEIGRMSSVANYSFYLGTSNENLEEIKRANKIKNQIAGLKIFMGSSTGNLLVDDIEVLDNVFANCDMLIATHCEEQSIIKDNYAYIKGEREAAGLPLTAADHPLIRNDINCYASSSKAIALARKHNARLHILHITDALELKQFTNAIPLSEKRITSEVCVHHLTFSDKDYANMSYQIKCNPAVKTEADRQALWTALLDDRLDVIATDHAPHLLSEKGLERLSDGSIVPTPDGSYDTSAAGLPLIQHTLQLMLWHVEKGHLTIEKMVEKMSHAVATCYQLKDRGFIREGYKADLVLVDLHKPYLVTADNLLYKCQWSPLEDWNFNATISHTFVNGNLVYVNGKVEESIKGERLEFDRH